MCARFGGRFPLCLVGIGRGGRSPVAASAALRREGGSAVLIRRGIGGRGRRGSGVVIDWKGRARLKPPAPVDVRSFHAASYPSARRDKRTRTALGRDYAAPNDGS